MNVPVFIEIEVEEQAEELRAYFKGLGAEIASERSDKGFEDDLHKIIGVCDACFKETNTKDVQAVSVNEIGPSSNDDYNSHNNIPDINQVIFCLQVEEVLNGIVSMLAQVEGEKRDNLILAFCEKLAKAPANAVGLACLKVLWTLYQSLQESSPMRVHVYLYLVELAGKTDQIGTVYKDMDTLRSAFSSCPPSNEQMQKLLRLLHQTLLICKRSEDAGQVMIELLGTYTTENASQAREEAQRCIVASLQDPQTFLLDHLLQLKPVKFLEGELIHDLLKIFVSERLEAYMKFYDSHREFVNKLGLNHESNMRKV